MGKGKEAEEQNMILAMMLARANEIIRNYYLRDIELTPTLFKQEFHQEASRTDFLAFWEEEMQSRYTRRQFGIATVVAETRTLEKLRDFQNPVLFSQISRKLLERFDEWHAKDLANRGYEGLAERGKALKQIKKYLLAAKAEGKKFTDPFYNFSFPKGKPSPVWLEESELDQLLRLRFNKEFLRERMREKAEADELRPFDIARYCSESSVENMSQHINTFLFSCFTGVRYSDLRRLSWAHVNEKDNLLIFKPKKTQDTSGKKVFFPLTPMIRSLFVSSSGHLVTCRSNQKYNKALKVIAELAHIDKRVTSHVGRHTFGSRMVSKGVSLVSLMELMGVNSLKTVMVYAHSGLEQQRKELCQAQSEYFRSCSNNGNLC